MILYNTPKEGGISATVRSGALNFLGCNSGYVNMFIVQVLFILVCTLCVCIYVFIDVCISMYLFICAFVCTVCTFMYTYI